MVNQALSNSKLFADYPESIHRYGEHLRPDAALLYPSDDAEDLESIPVTDKPSQLLILDGTWNHAKLLYRNWPQLETLRHIKITPQAPGNYRIRLEPNDHSLSTVEATVLALRHFEPAIPGLELLLDAFNEMVERQLAHPAAVYSGESSRKRPTCNIPASILDPNARLVFAYGEAEPIAKGSPKKYPRTPVYWIAQRSDDQSVFRASIESGHQVPTRLLEYFDLPQQELCNPLSISDFREKWRSFLTPEDILIVYNQNTIRMLNAMNAVAPGPIPIRSINFAPHRQRGSLGEFFAEQKIAVQPPSFPGRAGRRLANLVTLIKHLQLCHQPVASQSSAEILANPSTQHQLG